MMMNPLLLLLLQHLPACCDCQLAATAALASLLRLLVQR
jgi:hypothetical protein